MAYPNDEWQRKGATLSDKTARQEFGLSQDEIYDAIDAGTLHYRQAAMHGNPWLRLLRREVEALARTSRGDRYVDERQARPSWRTVTGPNSSAPPARAWTSVLEPGNRRPGPPVRLDLIMGAMRSGPGTLFSAGTHQTVSPARSNRAMRLGLRRCASRSAAKRRANASAWSSRWASSCRSLSKVTAAS